MATSFNVVMITEELDILSTCFEGFLYGLYCGIFALLVYLQFSSNKSRTPKVVFYVLCLLYVLSTACFVIDLLESVFQVKSALSPQFQIQVDSQSILTIIGFVQITTFGCCDFVSQCIIVRTYHSIYHLFYSAKSSKIYRCWIVWGKNIRFVIIPSFLAITFLATWLSLDGAPLILDATWDTWYTLAATSLAASMAVNALVTGLIVFRILKVSLSVNPTLVERNLGSTKRTKFRHIIFIIIESGMALFVIQLVRLVLIAMPETTFLDPATDFVVVTHEMLNGIAPTIILVRVLMRSSFDDEESFKEVIESLRFNNPPSDPDTLQRMGSTSGSTMSLQDFERDEDHITASNPNILRRVGSSSSIMIVPQERSGDIQ